MKVHLTPEQLALIGAVGGGALAGAVNVIRAGNGSIDWSAVAIAAATTGLAAYAQSHHPAEAPPPTT